MSFLGKEYTLYKQENFEAFVNSLDIPEDSKKGIIDHKAKTKLVKNGDTYTLYTSRPDNTSGEVSFKNGVEFDEQIHKNAAKTTFTVEGNTVTQVQKFQDGAVIFTFKREYSDNEVVVSITSSKFSGTAKRYYKA